MNHIPNVIFSYEKFTVQTKSMKDDQVSDTELKKVIADFLDQGHVENIVAMFKRDPEYYSWVGNLLQDERFSVRLGLSVLFEELQAIQPEKLHLAVPSLARTLLQDEALFRGEAISLLSIIGTDEALSLIRRHADDSSPQVREIVELVLEERQ